MRDSDLQGDSENIEHCVVSLRVYVFLCMHLYACVHVYVISFFLFLSLSPLITGELNEERINVQLNRAVIEPRRTNVIFVSVAKNDILPERKCSHIVSKIAYRCTLFRHKSIKKTY